MIGGPLLSPAIAHSNTSPVLRRAEHLVRRRERYLQPGSAAPTVLEVTGDVGIKVPLSRLPVQSWCFKARKTWVEMSPIQNKRKVGTTLASDYCIKIKPSDGVYL